MAYDINHFSGTTVPPSTDYPFGDVLNTPNGTIVDKVALDDMWQFFQKAMALSFITPNNTPDNHANGYQYIEAVFGETITAVTAGTGWTSGGVVNARRTACTRNKIQLDGLMATTSHTPSATLGTLMSGYRPLANVLFSVPKYTLGTTTYSTIVIQITNTGNITIPNASDVPTGVNDFIALDGVSYFYN
jgi:hypothetical protein